MKPKYFTLSLIILTLFIAGCSSRSNHDLKDSIITEAEAVAFRDSFLLYPNENYHIAEALMFETEEFDSLFCMEGIDKIRLYPAINVRGDDDADTLTFVMVPVNAANNEDNFSGYLFEYAKPCPSNCSSPGAAQAPTEQELRLTIPQSWCVSKETINQVFADAVSKVGAGNVYGIRFYWYNNNKGIMDLDLRPTTSSDGLIVDIAGLSYKGVTQICNDGEGCCDPTSPMYQTTRK